MSAASPAPSHLPSPLQGRLCILAAAVLWSLSGAFVKILREPTALGLGTPPVHELLIAFYRTLFAGLAILPTVRRHHLSFSPLMLLMMLSFGAMNALFISAVAMGTSANAIILQYTAPVWMYLAGVFLLKEPASGRSTIALLVSMTGVGVILIGAMREGEQGGKEFLAVLVALGSGVAYAGVLLCLRVLRGHASGWLTVQNHLFAALVLLPVLWYKPSPTWPQVAFLAFFGAVQMGLPYLLMARGMKAVSAQEAGTLSLLELILTPVWAYLAVGEVPRTETFYGGALVLAALLWRYWPGRRSASKVVTPKVARSENL